MRGSPALERTRKTTQLESIFEAQAHLLGLSQATSKLGKLLGNGTWTSQVVVYCGPS